VVPYPPGEATDSAVRVYADGLAGWLGQQIIVDYQAGGGTNIGAAYVAQSAPDVPPMAALGYSGVSVEPYFALVAPAAIPISIRQKLNDATRVVAKRPDVAKKLSPIGLIPVAFTLKETAGFLRQQGTKWAPVVKASGARVE